MNKEACACYVDSLEKENEALRLLLEWAIECNFRFGNFTDDDVINWKDFEKETKDIDYTESMIIYAKKYLEIKNKNK